MSRQGCLLLTSPSSTYCPVYDTLGSVSRLAHQRLTTGNCGVRLNRGRRPLVLAWRCCRGIVGQGGCSRETPHRAGRIWGLRGQAIRAQQDGLNASNSWTNDFTGPDKGAEAVACPDALDSLTGCWASTPPRGLMLGEAKHELDGTADNRLWHYQFLCSSLLLPVSPVDVPSKQTNEQHTRECGALKRRGKHLA